MDLDTVYLALLYLFESMYWTFPTALIMTCFLDRPWKSLNRDLPGIQALENSYNSSTNPWIWLVFYNNFEYKSWIVLNCASFVKTVLFLFPSQVVEHIDTLLEDWYPDLGSRFVQNSRGMYLITRLVPCMRWAFYRLYDNYGKARLRCLDSNLDVAYSASDIPRFRVIPIYRYQMTGPELWWIVLKSIVIHCLRGWYLL